MTARRWWGPAALLLGCGALAAAVAAGGMNTLDDDPHQDAFFAPEKCLTCHAADRDGRLDDEEFVKGIVDLCKREVCHPPMKLGRSHAVNVDLRHNRRFPDMRVPESLYVGRDNLLTCATCHETHGPWKDKVPTMGGQKPLNPGEPVLYYKTWYLRIRDSKYRYAKLCDACHHLL
jgi:cytochrome c553